MSAGILDICTAAALYLLAPDTGFADDQRGERRALRNVQILSRGCLAPPLCEVGNGVLEELVAAPYIT